MPLFLAEADNASLGLFIQCATAVLLLIVVGMQALRGVSGRENERKIEPTSLHAITQELGTQTTMLGKINREVGEVKTKVETVEKNVDGFHTRVGGISRELASTTARVEGLEKRELT